MAHRSILPIFDIITDTFNFGYLFLKQFVGDQSHNFEWYSKYQHYSEFGISKIRSNASLLDVQRRVTENGWLKTSYSYDKDMTNSD